jgi:KUP system potassium uptake protein
MWVWHRGATVVAERMRQILTPLDEFMAKIVSGNIPRVPGTAVFLTRTATGTPPVMARHVAHNRALHEHCFILKVTILPVPWLRGRERLKIKEICPNIWRGEAYFGFMETPDVPTLLENSAALGCTVDIGDITYYIGHEKVVHREDGKGLPLWQEKIFSIMERNSVHYGDVLGLPNDQVIEIGRQIAI